MVVNLGERWVVYQAFAPGNPQGLKAVCRQSEWDRFEAVKPGLRPLVRAGLRTEAEAERLARGTAGDLPPRASRFGFGAGRAN
jgi:hypothetical protein